MVCETCKSPHPGTYGSGRFCNLICARNYNREEINKKIKKALTGRKIPVDVREKYAKSIKAVKNDPDWKAKDALRREQKYRLAQFDDLCHTQKRRRVLEEQNFKCNVCQSDQMHNGKPLVFQLDHINGNRKDETRQNLQFLFPNCHSQTSTLS